MRRWPLAGLLLCLPWIAGADEPAPYCPAEGLDRFQYLRRLSLDLRQRPPSLDEYEALAGASDVADATIDGFLASPELSVLVRAYHAQMLWPALRKQPLFGAMAKLDDVPGDAHHRLFVAQPLRSSVYRGNPSGRACADRRQVQFDGEGTPIVGADGLDGWVEVEPYWAPGTTVRVCAFEAQARLAVPASVAGTAADVPCTIASAAVNERHCGCGPHLEFCATDDTQKAVLDALVEQAMRLVDRVGTGGRPYTDLVLSREIDVNGPLSVFLRSQWGFAHDDYVAPEKGTDVPELPWTAGWQTIVRGEKHAGVLTSPLYLLRNMTNRSRAHRWLETFLCSPLNPPPEGLKLEPSSEPNVAKRPGCAYCHATLEPVAAGWGRFAEAGMSYLDPPTYPTEWAPCRNAGWGDDALTKLMCQRLYIVEREPEGVLRSYEFARDGSPFAQAVSENAEAGPRGLAQAAVDDGRFARCTVLRWWAYLLRRPPTDAELAEDVPRLQDAFVKGGYRLPALLKALVTHPAYRAPHEEP